MRKFPLQLLILLVVRNSIDRSTESSGKPGSKQGKEQSEELGNTELGPGKLQEEKGTHTGQKEQGQAGGALGVPAEGQDTAEIQPQQLKDTFTGERLNYRSFPLM